MTSSKQQHILWAGSLIDNLSPDALKGAALVISDGMIQQVLKDFEPEKFAAMNEYRLMDLREYTVLPGFIDCHVHLALDGVDFQASQDRWSEDKTWRPMVAKSLEATKKCGIVAVRDGGDKGKLGLKAKKMVDAGKLEGPIILSCGQAVARKGRYGAFLGPGVSSVSEGLGLIAQNIKEGADWIKVVVSGIVSFREFGKVGTLQFSQAELNTLVNFAHAQGLPVMAHASSDEAVVMAVKAGVDSVEHGYFVSTSSLELLAEKGIPWVPTVIPVYCQESNSTEESKDIIKRTYELQLKKIYQAYELGVNIGVGTDAGAAGVQHGFAYWEELNLLAQAGLSNREVIRAATLDSAKVCGLGNQLGRLEPGKWACVMAVKGNPLEDLSVLKKS